MSVGSGIAASLGHAPGITYGTYAASTRWLEVDSADLKKVKNTAQGGGLAAGRLADKATQRVVTTLGAAGSIDLEVQNKSMGVLINTLMGGTPTVAQQAATAAYLQTHTLSDPFGKHLSMQIGVPDTAGTVRPFNFDGVKVLGAEFSSDIDGLLMSKWDIDARLVQETDTLVTPSYPTGVRPFSGTGLTVKVHATYGSEVSVSGVTGVSVKIARGSKADRYYAGAAGLKAEPIINERAAITGTINADFTDKTIWADRFAADTQFALVFEWVGPLIASTYFETFRVKLPACFLDGDTPTVGGEDVVNTSFPFTALWDGTNAAAIIEYMSTDTAI